MTILEIKIVQSRRRHDKIEPTFSFSSMWTEAPRRTYCSVQGRYSNILYVTLSDQNIEELPTRENSWKVMCAAHTILPEDRLQVHVEFRPGLHTLTRKAYPADLRAETEERMTQTLGENDVIFFGQSKPSIFKLVFNRKCNPVTFVGE